MKVICKLDKNHIKQIHQLYKQGWWSKDRSLEETQRVFNNSQIVIGILDKQDILIGFVRVLTDYTFKAFIFDLIVA